MPDFRKHILAPVFAGMMFLLIFPAFGFDEKTDIGKTFIYYVRLDQKIANGTYHTEAMSMIPADEDYRRLAFKTRRITGRVTTESKPEPLTDAIHDAISQLLLQSGTQSVRNKTAKDTQSTHEESVVSYEGYIRTPYRIIAQGYSKNGAEYSADIEVDFASMAYPKEWTFRFLIWKIRDGFATLFGP